jgi:hypothetical protein
LLVAWGARFSARPAARTPGRRDHLPPSSALAAMSRSELDAAVRGPGARVRIEKAAGKLVRYSGPGKAFDAARGALVQTAAPVIDEQNRSQTHAECLALEGLG